MSELASAFLLEMHAKLAAPLDIGATPEGHRLVILATGGHFEGPDLKGTVEPNSGGDWGRIRPDGSFDLDVRACLRTDDDALIYVTYRGRAAFRDQEQMGRVLDFNSENPVDPSEYYFRTNPMFETSHPKYDWLNRIVAIGKGKLGHGGVTYRIFEIK